MESGDDKPGSHVDDAVWDDDDRRSDPLPRDRRLYPAAAAEHHGRAVTVPTAQRARRNDIAPPRMDRSHRRPGWQVRTRLEALRADDAITASQYDAGEQFRRMREQAFPAMRSPLAAVGSRGRYAAGAPESALAALGRLREWHAGLGDLAFLLLEACCVDDQPWAELARRLHIHRDTARRWTITALVALDILATKC